ncbi:hypothetical protein VXM60_19380 [Shewanella khirikhana]|uniref:hypothetical protein n=1 Tax=Shewanella khirikhana TaxID=1965282 RepID=UPI0030CF5FF1
MIFSVKDEQLILRLSYMIDELLIALTQLGEDTNQAYQSVHKVKKILSSKDPRGMKNVKKHLMMDFRMIEDRQLDSDALNNVLDRIYSHVSSNEIFHA